MFTSTARLEQASLISKDYYVVVGPNLFNQNLFTDKITTSENRLERSDLPQEYLAI